MSIWGKVIGGVAGFAVGGPLGAILGAVAGHQVDKMRGGNNFTGSDKNARHVAFTTAVIVLSAKMAKADGVVTRDEVETFKKLFHIPPDEMKNIGRLFDEAKKEASGFEPYAEQIAMMFAHEPVVMEELMGGLFLVAKADGRIHPDEITYLANIAQIFGFTEHQFERLKTIHLGTDDETDAYEVLDLNREASDEEIKKRYRELIREHHPDTLIAKGVPQEFVDLANDKMAAINTAYDRIEKDRGLR